MQELRGTQNKTIYNRSEDIKRRIKRTFLIACFKDVIERSVNVNDD